MDLIEAIASFTMTVLIVNGLMIQYSDRLDQAKREKKARWRGCPA
jgi:hypothetical protein